MQITGVIDGAWEKTTKTGKPYTDYKINGQSFTAWAPKQFDKGAMVDVTYEEQINGQYTNRTIKAISATSGSAAAPAPGGAGGQPIPIKAAVSNDARQFMIVDQNSNTNATQLLLAMFNSDKPNVVKIMETLDGIDDILTMHTTIATYLSNKVVNGDYHNESSDDAFDDPIPY